MLERLLFCAAKADGAMQAAELDVMAAYCQEVTGDARITGLDKLEVVQGLDLLDVSAFGATYKKLKVFKLRRRLPGLQRFAVIWWPRKRRFTHANRPCWTFFEVP